MLELNTIYNESCLDTLARMPDESIDSCITSPPYFGLRDYGTEGQIGLEESPAAYVKKLIEVFTEIRRVLKKDGTVWLNLGDSYAGSGKGLYADGNCYLSDKSSKQKTNVGSVGVRIGSIEGDPGHTHGVKPPAGWKAKDLIGIPWRVAFALQESGWYLRQDIIWAKPNPMPESVTDRCTKSHEYIFLLTKSARYFYDSEAVREPAVNLGPDNFRNELAYINQTGPQDNSRISWKGSEFHTGQTAIHQLGRSSKNRDRTVGNRNGEGASTLDVRKHRKPAGWDTGEGAHGTIHRTGRAEEIEYTEIEKTGRNKRSVWTIATQAMPEAHFATFPEKLIEPCILAGSRPGGIIYDPFMGAGTTALVAHKLGRKWIGSELNPEYVRIAMRRLEPVLAQSTLFDG